MDFYKKRSATSEKNFLTSSIIFGWNSQVKVQIPYSFDRSQKLCWLWNQVIWGTRPQQIISFHLKIFQTSYIKFIYSEKATKFCKIFTLLSSYVVPVKSKVNISQNFVAFSEYVSFKKDDKKFDIFSNFPCRFLNPNNFFQFES